MKKLLNKRSIQDGLSDDGDKLSINENVAIKPINDLGQNAVFEDQACGGGNVATAGKR